MAFKIISSRDPKTGAFIASADNWNEERIEALLKKYNPKGTIHYHVGTADSADNTHVEKEAKI